MTPCGSTVAASYLDSQSQLPVVAGPHGHRTAVRYRWLRAFALNLRAAASLLRQRMKLFGARLSQTQRKLGFPRSYWLFRIAHRGVVMSNQHQSQTRAYSAASAFGVGT